MILWLILTISLCSVAVFGKTPKVQRNALLLLVVWLLLTIGLLWLGGPVST